MQLTLNQIIKSKQLIFKSYNLATSTGEMLLSEGTATPVRVYLPLTLAEFELGMYGEHSWIHPTDLPTSNPNFLTWHNKESYQVRHNRTGELCYLLLSKEFHVTGEFKLTPVSGGSPSDKHSVMYNRNEAKKKLDELIGALITIRGRILGFIVDGVLEHSILLNSITSRKKNVIVLFSSLKWMSIGAIPLDCLNLANEKPTSVQKQKWRKKSQKGQKSPSK